MGLLGSIAGGLFGIGSSAIQNSQNRQNVRETNQMNYKINQMNNQFNERMAMQQRDFQENMWNKENEYNTASAQRQRLEEAGLNPYLMMNGGSAGTAQSVGTGASASSAGSAVMQPFQADYSGVQQAIGSVFQSQVQQAQVSQLQGQKNLADAQAMQALSNVDWSKMTKETREYLKATGLARAQLGYSKEMQELDNMAFAGRLLQAQGTTQLLDAEAKTVLNKYLDQHQQADLSAKAAEYYNQMSHGHLNYNQAKKVLADEVLTYARAKGQKISNKVAESTADSLIRASNAANHSNAEYSEEQSKYSRKNALNDAWDKYHKAMINKKRNKFFDSDRYVHYGTSIGNTIGNFLPW
uniref:DNA pilot protein n=1 Tax=Dulem virus 257 TaxID=3145734 RepID=A0AAU8ATJ6_9VIRU